MGKKKPISDTESSESVSKFMPRSVKRESIFYAHVTEDNKKYMEKQAAKFELSLSEYTDQLITRLRDQKII